MCHGICGRMQTNAGLARENACKPVGFPDGQLVSVSKLPSTLLCCGSLLPEDGKHDFVVSVRRAQRRVVGHAFRRAWNG
jgi:hypothetical protein